MTAQTFLLVSFCWLCFRLTSKLIGLILHPKDLKVDLAIEYRILSFVVHIGLALWAGLIYFGGNV